MKTKTKKVRYLKLLSFLLLMTVLISSCRKDAKEDFLPQTLNVDYRSPSKEKYTPNHAQLLAIWQDFRQKHTVEEQQSFYHEYGFIKWSAAQIRKETPDKSFLLSVPTTKEKIVESVLFAWKHKEEIKYVHVSRKDLSQPTGKIIEKYGVEVATLMIMSFLNHEKEVGDYYSGFLGNHLSHPKIKSIFKSNPPKGWCLIEVELVTSSQGEINDEICNCSYYNSLTGHTIMNPPADFDPEKDDPTWQGWLPHQEYSWAINGGSHNIIHGGPGENGTTVYHFWGWCPDEEDQNPGAFNWVTNIKPPSTNGSTGGNTPITPTLEEIQEQNWDFFVDNFNDPFTKKLIEDAIQSFLDETGLSFDEFIRYGGLDCVDFTYEDGFVTGASFDEDCDNFDDNGIGFPICESTFPFKAVGEGFTVQLNWIRNVLASTDSRPSLTYKIPVLCIQVGQFDNTGNLISTPNRAAELTTIAYENARQSVLDDWFLGLITNDVQAASAFVTDFRFELLSQFSSTTLSTGNCDGSIPESRPYYNVFGICLPVIY